MVAIKIQSLEDIVKAYLQNFGFDGKKLDDGVELLIAQLGDKYDTDNVLSSLDELVYKPAQQIFGKQKIAKEQKIAMFKLCFLLNNGAKYWSVDTVLGNEVPEDMIAKLQEKMVVVTPVSKASQMKPQVIEMLQPGDFIKKIIHDVKKV